MISTDHRLVIGDAKDLGMVQDESIDLVVTSPPYPMVEMWDKIFSTQNPEIGEALAGDRVDGGRAFGLMHRVLDRIWGEVGRVLRRGGIACINIGDATRSIGGMFQLFSNHTRVLQYFTENNFVALPPIIWRKQTNVPNKFMGSGMLPPGAYVTLEHEYILILRKGGKRNFITAGEKENRRASSYFWEERNLWFSDVWEDLKGVNQRLDNNKGRDRSAAYPYELAHRLINMFSVKGDTVLDPFVGTGTTMLAAMGNERNSIGVEIDSNFKDIIKKQLCSIVSFANDRIIDRLKNHLEFTRGRLESGRRIKYGNICYKFPVVTRQEIELQLNLLKAVQENSDWEYTVYYREGTENDLRGS